MEAEEERSAAQCQALESRAGAAREQAAALRRRVAALEREKAALAEDIRAMPMKMHTIVTEGGGTLSGGQRQRLLIARALARSPRLLFFDEATSALDNQTQAVVSESLEQLQATRIVVAHRLSTVRHADRILVLKRGRLVEEGDHETLMRLGGEYASLARRQIS